MRATAAVWLAIVCSPSVLLRYGTLVQGANKASKQASDAYNKGSKQASDTYNQASDKASKQASDTYKQGKDKFASTYDSAADQAAKTQDAAGEPPTDFLTWD